ncbi:DUF523 domain-containing protein [Ancylomarina sp. 16SWW S1-10-2]|nr:DUF523 domain-containing protein [Ancylomarina sp. 16SWW S1-10-2]
MYLISACLLGVNCRYNGASSRTDEFKNLLDSGRLIPVCPEVLGGLDTPREPCEIIKQTNCSLKIMSQRGLDCTTEFREGAQKVLEMAKICHVKKVILKANSPSCGSGYIYDGTFTGKLIEGYGVTSKLLIENDIQVYNEVNWKSGEFI